MPGKPLVALDVAQYAITNNLDLSHVKPADGRVIRMADVNSQYARPRTARPRTAPSMPWAPGTDPVQWAKATGRITNRSEARWRADHKRDPAGTEQWLAALTPVAVGGGMLPYVDPGTGPYARSPLVGQLHAQIRASAASTGVPAPDVFESGEVPPITASGMDPQELRRLPWQARPVVAAEPDRGRALELFETYVNNPDGAAVNLASDPRVQDYQRRVDQWAADNASVDAAYAAVWGDEALARAKADEQAERQAERARRAAHLAALDTD